MSACVSGLDGVMYVLPNLEWCYSLVNLKDITLNGVNVQALDVPSPALQQKLARANRESQVVDISRAPIAYDTAQPPVDSTQSGEERRKGDVEYELDDFDSRLKRRRL